MSFLHRLRETFVWVLLLIRGIIEDSLFEFFGCVADVKFGFSNSLVLVLRNLQRFIIFVIRQPKFHITLLPLPLLVTLLYLNDWGEHSHYRIIFLAIALALIIFYQILLRFHSYPARTMLRLFRWRLLRYQHFLYHFTYLIGVLHPQRLLECGEFSWLWIFSFSETNSLSEFFLSWYHGFWVNMLIERFVKWKLLLYQEYIWLRGIWSW